MAQSKYDVSKAETLASVWEMAVGHATSFGMKAAVSLGIPDILAQSGQPMSLTEIAAELPGSNVQKDHLLRLLNYLAVKNVLHKVEDDSQDEESRFQLTKFSELLTKSNFGGLLMLQNEVITAGWHHMPEFILHGGKSPFERAKGMSIWENAQANPELAMLFSTGMVAMSNVTMEAILASYDGFERVKGVLVDVGGGFGADVHRIVTAYPQIQGINLELPTVVQVAPQIPGVEHVAGDMFHTIPKADAILLKAVLHDFDDEAAVVVLKKCYDALPEGGKVIIVDIIMDPPEQGPFESLKLAFDLVLFALTNGGLERTQAQWIKLLTRSGFHSIQFVSSPSALQAVVEAQK